MKKIFLLLFSQTLSISKNLKIGLIVFVSIIFSSEAFASHAAGMDITYKYVGAPAGITGRQVTIKVITDYYGSDASWDITDAAGNIYASGGPYTNSGTTNNRTHTVTICLPTNTSLDFNWYDSYGNGWNSWIWWWGTLQGSYSVKQGSATLTSGIPSSGYGGSSTFTVNNSGAPCTTTETLKYEITLAFYRECNAGGSPGLAAPNSIDIRYKKMSGGSQSSWITLPRLPGSTNITPVCSTLPGDPCTSGLISNAYVKYTYKKIITLPSRDSWKIWNDPIYARNATTYGSIGGGNWDDLCVIANIDNTTYLSSSPVFSLDPVGFLCAGSGSDCFYNGATDPDLDNLSYSLIQPKTNQGVGSNMPYQSGATYLQPYPSSTTTCDPLTGDLCINTSLQGTSVAAIKVSEFRNGTNIGFVTRDIQLLTKNCTSVSPPSSTVTSGLNTTFNSINNSFSFCVDGSSQLSFDIQAISTVDIEMLGSVLPSGATFTTNPSNPLSSNTITGTFSWTPTAADIAGSPYVININVSDDNCPLPNSTSETYLIYLNGFGVTDNSTPLTSCTPSNGTASVTPNGSSSYSYAWNTSPAQTTATANGLIAGTYICTVTDNTTGCITDSPPIIVASTITLPTVTASATTNTICDGDPVTLNGSGTIGVTYSWNNGATNGTSINPNVTTTYTLTGTDANGCENTDNVTVTVNSLPTVTANSTPGSPLCEGDDLTLNGGGAATYSWDNSVIDNTLFTQANGTITYTVTGIDANSCENTATISITVNPLPTVTVSSTPLSPLCIGDNLTLNGSGATTYSWDNSVIDNTSFTPAVGTVTYNVIGTDANACENTATISITVNQLPTVIANSTPGYPLCEGDDLTLNGSGATTYIWNDGTSNYTDGLTFNPAAGTAIYTVTGTDAIGCENTDNVTVTVNANTTSTDTEVHCDSYTWLDGVTYSSSNNTATFTSTNLAGCTNTATLDLTINNSTISTDVQVHCLPYTWLDGVTYANSNNTATWTTIDPITGCDNVATLNLTISSITTSTDNVGTHCDSYTWLDGVTYTASNNTATWTTTDAAGCTNVATLDLTITNSTTSIDSQIHCDTYTWLDGITYNTSNNTATFTSTNAAGCNNVATLNLTINNSTASTDNQVHCNSYTWLDGITYTSSNNTATYTSTNVAGCDNVATLDLTINNSTSSSFSISECNSYNWDGISYTMSGTYVRTLNTINGCDSVVTLSLIIISGGFEITTNIDITDVDCFGMNNGAINLYPNGGISPLTFNWDNGATTQNINSLTAGNYSFTITDSIGCTLDSTVSVSEPDKLIVSFQANDEICRNDSISILIELSNPIYNYYTVQFYDSIQKSFIIDSSGVLIPEGIPFYIIPSLSNQIQLISVTDNNGCTSDINQPLDIIVNEFPILEINQDDICVGSPSFTLNQGKPNGGDYFIDDINTNFFDVENLEDGAYTIRYDYTDNITNCSNSIEKIININPNPIADFSFSPQPTDIDNPAILFVNESENIDNTKWSLADGTTLIDELEFWYTYADTGTYDVIYAVRNQFNCSDTAKATLIINPVYQIFIPSAFTPNNDGDNDNFKVEIIGQKEYLMTIFNRWGEIIFEEKNGAWDGKINNNVVQNGTYSYTILVTDFKDKAFIYKGIVTLIK